MSDAVLPVLAGMSFPVEKSPMWSTRVQESVSGKETRLSYWSYPRWKWTLPYDVLRSGSELELQQLLGFFNARQGRYDSWLFDDPDDNFITDQPFAIGDGSTASFQLSRSYGGYLEPITAPKDTNPLVASSTTLVAQGANISIAGGNVTRSGGTAGYTQGAYISESYSSGSWCEFTVGSNSSRWIAGLYLSPATSGGTESGMYYAFYLETNSALYTAPATTPIGSAVIGDILRVTYDSAAGVVRWLKNGVVLLTISSGIGAGANLQFGSTLYTPSCSILGIKYGPYRPTTNGLLTLASALPSGKTLSWTGGYRWRCRFLEDTISASKFMERLWELRALEFQSVK